MTDQQCGGHAPAPETGGGSLQIGDVGVIGGVGEFAVAVPQPGEIEAQDRDSHGGQPPGDAARGRDVLAAGETVREERRGEMRAVGQVEPRGQRLA